MQDERKVVHLTKQINRFANVRNFNDPITYVEQEQLMNHPSENRNRYNVEYG